MNTKSIKKKILLLYRLPLEGKEEKKAENYEWEIKNLSASVTQEEYVQLLNTTEAETVLLLQDNCFSWPAIASGIEKYLDGKNNNSVGYINNFVKKERFTGIFNLWKADKKVVDSPLLIGPKSLFLKAYAGGDLAADPMEAIGYSLYKTSGINFCRIETKGDFRKNPPLKEGHRPELFWNYAFGVPFTYLFSGKFFREFFQKKGRVPREMTFRALMFLFIAFAFVFMPYISQDYGITGDEPVDSRHAGYVLDYFTKGDPAAINQPKTALHLYGISMQVIAAAVCELFHIDHYYETRHVICALNGALGILFAGLLGLRLGGGLCGLLSVLLMFFTPRYFGHSMNNLKDIPFAVGYLMAVYYTIRLFDYYPFFRLRHIIGLVLGIALALGTRSGGLILYPMLLMYGGLYYISTYGVREFYKIGKYRQSIWNILQVFVIVIVSSYILAILLWPFALQKPLSNVLFSLQKFTNYSIGLRTIFDGEQMMSNMLPWKYAPKYLLIGMPLITVLGCIGSGIYVLVRRKAFVLPVYFIFFAFFFPLFWVIYKNSNLYGGIRHLLFVIPPMVVLSAFFWTKLLEYRRNKQIQTIVLLVLMGLLVLPVIHFFRNHPNQYVYFNELAGGLKKSYGNYETDYYFNSLKASSDWFKKNVQLPSDRKTVIVTQFPDGVSYYFRKDTNVKVIYSRYYEKYSKDWDYALFGNVYVNRFQLQQGLYPPDGNLYSPAVDGYPVSCVVRRPTKKELKGFELEKENRIPEALQVFEEYTAEYPGNEEVWSRMAKLYYVTKQYDKVLESAEKALSLHPALNEALYMQAMAYIKGGNYPAALSATERMLAQNSVSVDAHYLKALVYFSMKNYQEAINCLNKLLNIRPNDGKALLLAADIIRINGDYRQAAELYSKVVKVIPDISALTHLADCLCRIKNYAQAEQVVKKVLKAEPNYLPLLKVELRLKLMQHNYAEAAHLLSRLSGVNTDAELFVLRALYMQALNKSENALTLLDKALQLEPDNREALLYKKKGNSAWI